ncbi:ABC transporter ATP-binding protein [Myxococcota bacterium]|jgi:ABC-type cobalamin/Fe3+-siderophores transport system ATPase subunit|nr:ABC transporter ATP-binding protein [Myxococcota bacterium]MBU1413625.1 ABC transporter ATP-binding protein [Myxococcota bacterium]MBU1509217.1 ABC transporter ATP-binding protein [Myxococcota bacterium]
MPVWELTDLAFGHPHRRLAEGIGLTIEAGMRVAIAGPNGAGKSTLLHLLAGLHRPDAGGVRFRGRPLEDYHAGELARLRSLMVQLTPADLPLSVFETAALGLAPRNGGAFASQSEALEVEETLADVGLAGFSDRPYDELSGGEKRRVLLARALLQSSEVLLLDEPTAAFDPAQTLQFHRMLRRLGADRGSTVVMVTHLIDTLPEFSHVLLLSGGRWVFGPAVETLREHGSRFFGVDLCFGQAPDGSLTLVAREPREAVS